ncbi:MAG: ATP-binding protein [Deltaproteobacteria bacterium]|nr:ATP-binding protein [Deltaproteobacteria bacterium]
MKRITQRILELKLPTRKSAFLWGPRQVGKSYWIQHQLQNYTLIDLLQSDVYAEYVSRPHLLRERYQNHSQLIVIDEVQKIPALLDEVHGLIENQHLSFLLTGSSARKLKRGHANLLGGRAWRRQMVPLSFIEVEGFDLESVMQSGLLPPHFLSENPLEDLRSYVADYLKEEIAAEALTQNIPAFTEFLRVAALTNSELLNYANVARECGVSARIVRNYFDILEDTYLGFRISPWKKSRTRRLIETEKFYLFDVGVSNYLAKRTPKIGSAEFGKSLEHYILMEIKAYQAYRNPEMEIRYWRTSTGQEVDFILGEMDVAIEIKGGARVHETDCKSLKILKEEYKAKKCILVSLEKPRKHLEKDIMCLYWQDFVEGLWAGEWI